MNLRAVQSNKTRWLLQTAAVVFLLNSANAFGACCFLMDQPNEAGQPPCHQSTEAPGVMQQADTELTDSCCVSCAPAAPVHFALSAQTTQPAEPFLPQSVAQPITGLDPPYRPPIQTV